MITQSSGAQRASTPNLDTRNAPRSENGSDFHEEIARGRGRDRADERATHEARPARDAGSAGLDTTAEDSDLEPRSEADAVHDPSSPDAAAPASADEPEASAADPRTARPVAIRADESAVQTATPHRAVAPDNAASPTASTEPASITASAAVPIAMPFPALDPARDLEARMQAHAASGDDAPLELPTSSAPTARIGPLDSSPPAVATDVARPVGESTSPRGLEVARDAAPSTAALESGSSAVHVHAVRTPSITEVAPTAPTALPRLTPAEVPQFFETLAMRVDGSTNQAFVELEPPELGRLTIEISLQADGGVRADVRAEKQDGYAALGSRVQEMRTAFLDRGFTTADVQLSFGLAERDARPGPDPRSPRRAHTANERTIDTERVLALAAPRTGSIDVWA